MKHMTSKCYYHMKFNMLDNIHYKSYLWPFMAMILNTWWFLFSAILHFVPLLLTHFLNFIWNHSLLMLRAIYFNFLMNFFHVNYIFCFLDFYCIQVSTLQPWLTWYSLQLTCEGILRFEVIVVNHHACYSICF